MLRIYDYGSFFLETLSGSSCPSSDPSPSHSLHVFITVVWLSAATCVEVKGLISSKSSYLCCHQWLQIQLFRENVPVTPFCSFPAYVFVFLKSSFRLLMLFPFVQKNIFLPVSFWILSIVLPSKFTNPFFPAPSYLALTKCIFHLRHCAFICRSLS